MSESCTGVQTCQGVEMPSRAFPPPGVSPGHHRSAFLRHTWNSFYGVLIYGSHTLVIGGMVQLWGRLHKNYSLCCPNHEHLWALLMLWVAGWCPAAQACLITFAGIQCSRKELAECKIHTSSSKRNAVQMLHSHGAAGDLLSSVETLQWHQPFSAARVVQSSDHASQNLGQSLFKHMELEERRKYSDFLYLGCGLSEAVSLLAGIKSVCQRLAGV